jgi:hypothetical protein
VVMERVFLFAGPFYVSFLCARAYFRVWAGFKEQTRASEPSAKVAAAMALPNVVRLTTERICEIAADSTLWMQARANQPRFFDCMCEWVEVCVRFEVWDFACAILCCRVLLLQKIGDGDAAQQCVEQLRSVQGKVQATAPLYAYFQEKLKAIQVHL